MLELSSPQAGWLNITATPGYSQYRYAYNIYANDNIPSHAGDLTDYISAVFGQPPALGGFGGSITMSCDYPRQSLLAAARGDPQLTGFRQQSFQVNIQQIPRSK